jgi:hypothetical protein
MLNKFQKAACRPGEQRVNGPEVAELIELSRSHNPDERLMAASLLCPCHVRRRVEAAWDALHRMMEDPDVRVRKAAWHTLEDGGGGNTPAVQAIASRVLAVEKDAGVLKLINEVCGSAHDRLTQQRFEDAASIRSTPRRRGKCDFCGNQTMVADQLDTEIPSEDGTRAARICAACERRHKA